VDNTTYSSASTDVIGELYNDSVFDEAVTFSFTASNVISLTVKPASGQKHTGVAGTGARLVKTANLASSLFVVSGVACPFVLEDFEISMGGFSITAGGRLLENTMTAAVTNRFARLIVHDAVSTAAANLIMALFGGNVASSVCNFLNSVVYNGTCDATGAQNANGVIRNVDRDRKVLNVVLYNLLRTATGTGNATGINDLAAGTLATTQNCISMSVDSVPGTEVCFNLVATADHNMSSDATAGGTGSLTNKSA
jgi:hypothetical protein